MVFRYTEDDTSQALDINQQLALMAGYGLVEGGEPSTGARPFAVDFRQATAIVNGETVELPATSVNLDDYTPDEDPRKAVIYIAINEDGEGEYRVAAGKEADPKPEDAIRFDTYQPAPPDLRDIDGAEVVEVWLGGPSQPVSIDDIRDRRLSSKLTAHNLTAETAEFDAIIDGGGRRHEGQLGDFEKEWTDADIREAVNSDPDHGTNAPHLYFSGSHDDLTDIRVDQHHVRRKAEDFRAAMTDLDAADLAGDMADVPGMHLSIPDGETTEWTEPPMAEASVVDTGTITHSGGSTTVVTIEDVTPTPDYALELETGVSVETPPTWSGDYDYTPTAAYRWDETAEMVDLELTLEWDTDPGAGNDLELRYRVIDMSERGAKGLYGPDDVIDAVDSIDLSLSELVASERVAAGAVDELPDPSGYEIGDTVVLTGDGTEDFGSYIHDGTSWAGPYAEGLTSLSDLVVDIAADWNGYRIPNIGQSTGPAAIIQQQEIAEHAGNVNAHHDPLTGADIDHTELQNVGPDQHHPEPTGERLGRRVAGNLFEVPFPASSIQDGESSRIHVRVASYEEFRLVRGELSNQFGNTPSGLQLQVRDHRSDELPYSQNTDREVGTVSNPLVTVPGPMHMEIRVNNTTGDIQVAGGLAAYTIQRT